MTNVPIHSPRLYSPALFSVPEAEVEFSTWATTETVSQTTGLSRKIHTHMQTPGVPGVLLAGVPSAVQRDDFLSADARFADGTLLPAGPRLQPLRRAREEENRYNADQTKPFLLWS